jgi:hypothetical protein
MRFGLRPQPASAGAPEQTSRRGSEGAGCPPTGSGGCLRHARASLVGPPDPQAKHGYQNDGSPPPDGTGFVPGRQYRGHQRCVDDCHGRGKWCLSHHNRDTFGLDFVGCVHRRLGGRCVWPRVRLQLLCSAAFQDVWIGTAIRRCRRSTPPRASAVDIHLLPRISSLLPLSHS